MDGTVELGVFLVGTFTAACVTGIAGFAFGLIAAAIWLHALTPLQSTSLIVAYALIVQGYAVWKLRGSLNYRRLLPFLLGSALGIPVGVALLQWASPAQVRIGVGVLLVLFSLYSLARPRQCRNFMTPVRWRTRVWEYSTASWEERPRWPAYFWWSGQDFAVGTRTSNGRCFSLPLLPRS